MGMMSSLVNLGTLILQTGINTLGTSVIVAHTAARKVFEIWGLPVTVLEMCIRDRINIASSICVETYTDKGDGIIMHTPAYGPLQNSILKNNRKMLSSPLKKNGEHYEMDFAQMESMVDEHTKMMILCNPHNPTGRAWTKDELVQVADFCREHDLILFTDEIHGDLMKAGVRHQTALDVTEEMNDRLILASSPTKTFNIPGVIAVSYTHLDVYKRQTLSNVVI